ncbi:MAG: [FeFe] hydrogenase, group A, partial [bacterium]
MKPGKVKIIIDDKEILVDTRQTIMEAAKENGIEIPGLCYHPDLDVKANCRMCMVEVKGTRCPQTACTAVVQEGMEIKTKGQKINRLRKFNLELIFAQHLLECDDCVWKWNCLLLKYAKEYNVKKTRFPDRKKERPITQFGPIVFDQTKCIDCRNCVEVCPVNYLEVEGRGSDIGITPSRAKSCLLKKVEEKDCIHCGQCIVHCPVGAIETAGEFEYSERPFEAKKQGKILVAEFAPAVRSSLGEMFGMPYGEVVTGKVTAGLRKLGFDYVFDTSVSADFTTVEEAMELAERIKSGGKLPMFTSCCPSWVKYVEFYRPDLLPNLTIVRSPQIIMGGLLKTYFADRIKVDPRKLEVVSIMPCTAKKFESRRPELKIKDMYPVDFVLTTRELGNLFKKHKIDLKTIEPELLDDPFGMPSGAGIIYGTSGGVMEAALRTVYFLLCGKDLECANLEQVRGAEGIKCMMAEVPVLNKKIKVAVAAGMENARKLLKILDNNPSAYDYIEIMACPNGCVGGGGQPLPVDNVIRQKRSEALYGLDNASVIRLAHKNPVVMDVLKNYFTTEKLAHSVFHTGYKKKAKTKIMKLKNSRE